VLVGLFVVGAISSVIDLTDWYSRWPVPWWVWVIAVLVILVITLAQKWHQAERELENVRAGRAQASRLDRKLKQEFDERIDEAAKLLELGVVNDDWIRQSDEWVARTVSWIEEHFGYPERLRFEDSLQGFRPYGANQRRQRINAANRMKVARKRLRGLMEDQLQ
jgi:hypothetical protein